MLAEHQAEAAYPSSDPGVYYDTARRQLDHQLESMNQLDAKVAALFGWSSGVITALVAILALRAGAFHAAELSLAALSFTAYAFVVAAALRHFWPQPVSIGPRLDQIWRDYWELNPRLIKWRIATHLVDAQQHNQPLHTRKARSLLAVLCAAAIQTVLLCAALALVAGRA